MYSTGNDIVSLVLIDKERSNSRNFYAKILTPSEEILCRQHVSAHISFESLLWLCWSVKESVYKYLKRKQPELVFSPVKIVVQDIITPSLVHNVLAEGNDWEGDASCDENYTGSLVTEDNIYYFRSKLSPAMIATVVSEDANFTNVLWGIRTIADDNTDRQSAEVRTFVLQRLQTIFPGKQLTISNARQEYPVIINEGKELPIPLSFAHHGKLVAYSMRLIR